QLAAAQPLRIHQALGAEQPLHQLLFRHFEGKDRDPHVVLDSGVLHHVERERRLDRKSTRLNSSHVSISYAVFCLKKKKQTRPQIARATPPPPAPAPEPLRRVGGSGKTRPRRPRR